MNKRERLEKAISGEALDRVPVALWRHWPGDDQRAADLARAVVDFQKNYDWDMVSVCPANTYSVLDYGVQAIWEDTLDGCYRCVRPAVRRSLEWTELRPLDPMRGELGKQLECLRLVGEALGNADAPILQIVYSPLMQAQLVAGKDLLIRNIRTHPDRLRTGLNIITESTLRFIEAIRRTAVAGIIYIIEHACYDIMPESEYLEFGVPYDRKILDALPNTWSLNGIQVQGQAPMLRVIADYPVQFINWEDIDGRPNLERGKTMVNAAVCGGLSSWEHLHKGTPAMIRDAARQAIQQTDGRRHILSAGRAIPITTPLSNIRAVREVMNTSKQQV